MSSSGVVSDSVAAVETASLPRVVEGVFDLIPVWSEPDIGVVAPAPEDFGGVESVPLLTVDCDVESVAVAAEFDGCFAVAPTASSLALAVSALGWQLADMTPTASKISVLIPLRSAVNSFSSALFKMGRRLIE